MLFLALRLVLLAFASNSAIAKRRLSITSASRDEIELSLGIFATLLFFFERRCGVPVCHDHLWIEDEEKVIIEGW